MAEHGIWMPLYVADYLADTRHLSTSEHGAYLLLLMHAWTNNGALPADEKRLARIACMRADEWEEAREAVLDFFYMSDDGYRSRRLEVELAKARDKISKRRAAGKRGAQARWQKDSSDMANAMANASDCEWQNDGQSQSQSQSQSQEQPASQSAAQSDETENTSDTDGETSLDPCVPAVIAAMGIVSPGSITEAGEAVDSWVKAGVGFPELIDAARKSKGAKKNQIGYMRSIIKPELEKIAKAKAQQAERQRQAEQGPDWPQVMKAWASHRQWPYAMPGIGPEPWKKNTRVPAPLLEQYAAIIEQERASNAWFEPAEDQSIGF